MFQIRGNVWRNATVFRHAKLLAKNQVLYTSARATDLNSAVLEAVQNGVDLTGAFLQGLSLPGMDLRNAKLGRADKREANLEGANLSHADLSGDLGDSNLARADLTGARLDAYLCGADLSGANLSGVRLDPGSHRISWLKDVKLTGADVRGARVHEDCLINVDFTECRNLVELVLISNHGEIGTYRRDFRSDVCFSLDDRNRRAMTLAREADRDGRGSKR